MPALAVVKMHGTLNDFVVLDQRPPTVNDLRALACELCERRGGIGADGLIVLLPSLIADAKMRIVNADGSEAEMCGNGMRCAVRYLSERGEGDRFRIETIAGIISAEVLAKGAIYSVRLKMGVPAIEPRELAIANAHFVSVGNPHAVLFTSVIDSIDLSSAAGKMPEMNVHAACIIDRRNMAVRHYERGVGLTYACGTGAVACAALAIAQGRCDDVVEVRVPGGVLRVEWDGEHEAYLTGPAVRVFDAQIAC